MFDIVLAFSLVVPIIMGLSALRHGPIMGSK